MSTKNMLAQIEETLTKEFASVSLKFAVQSFTRHVELWVYVLDLNEYQRIRDRCYQLTEEMKLEQAEPEVWLMAKTWTGPWPGGESEQEIKRRREEFKRAHNLNIGTPA